MSLTAGHYLDIWRNRVAIQDASIVTPNDGGRRLAVMLVEKLEALDQDEVVELRKTESGFEFVITKTGEAFAEVDLIWYSSFE